MRLLEAAIALCLIIFIAGSVPPTVLLGTVAIFMGGMAGLMAGLVLIDAGQARRPAPATCPSCGAKKRRPAPKQITVRPSYAF